MTERRFSQLPDSPLITPEVRALDAEARTLVDRRKVAVQQRQALESVLRLDQAKKADAKAAAAAVRAGKAAATVGSPAVDELAADKLGLDQEVDALTAALTAVEDEMEQHFQKAIAEDRTSGRAGLKAAEQTYRKAIDALSTARRNYTTALSIERWFDAAAAGSNADVQHRALQLANSPIVAPIPGEFGIRPEVRPRLPFDQLLNDITIDDLSGDLK